MSGENDANFLNKYLSGNDFRGPARSAGGDDELSHDGGDGLADESLLVSPILADYIGGVSSVRSGGSAKKPPAAKSRAGAPEGIGIGSIPEGDEGGVGENEGVDASSSSPRVNLGVQLQLDTSLCPSLGLGSVGSDDGSMGEDAAEDNENSGVPSFVPSEGSEAANNASLEEKFRADECENEESVEPMNDMSMKGFGTRSESNVPLSDQDSGESGIKVGHDAKLHITLSDNVASPPHPSGPDSAKTSVRASVEMIEMQVEGGELTDKDVDSIQTDGEVAVESGDDDAFGQKKEECVPPNEGDAEEESSGDIETEEATGGADHSNIPFGISECALSPIANDSSSPDMSRTMKVKETFDDIGCEIKHDVGSETKNDLEILGKQQHSLETSSAQPCNEGDNNGLTLMSSTKKVGMITLRVCSNVVFVGEQVHKVVETAVGSTEKTTVDGINDVVSRSSPRCVKNSTDDAAAVLSPAGEECQAALKSVETNPRNDGESKVLDMNRMDRSSTAAFDSKVPVTAQLHDEMNANDMDSLVVQPSESLVRSSDEWNLSRANLPSPLTIDKVDSISPDLSTKLVNTSSSLPGINELKNNLDISSEAVNAGNVNTAESVLNGEVIAAASRQPGLSGGTNALLSPPSTEVANSKFDVASLADSPPSADLSSAKKKLGATSNALVERLRGAAQKRKLLVTRSRDSLVAKEQQQIMSSQSSLASDDTEKSCSYESPEPKEESRKQERNKFDGINPRRTFVARPLPATTGDLGHGGQVGVPKVPKRPATVPRSPQLGYRRKAKEKDALQSESKAYLKIKEEESSRKALAKQPAPRPPRKDSAVVPRKPLTEVDPYVPFKARPLPATTGDLGHGGQNEIPKVAKRPTTVPSSPQLGMKRGTATSDNLQQIRKSVTGENKKVGPPLPVSATRSVSAVKQSALKAKPFERLLAGSDASRAKERTLKEKTEREEAEARRKSSFRARPLPSTSFQSSPMRSPGLRGLELLSSNKRPRRKQGSSSGEENMIPNEGMSSGESPPKKQCIASSAPDRLHSTRRAKERAHFDERRSSQLQKRHQQEVEERKHNIQKKYKELDRMRETLRDR